MTSRYGWSPKGKPVIEKVPCQKGVNYSVLGALSLSGIVATFQKEGSIKRVDFEAFLERDLLPNLRKGSVVVLDNARSHHGGNIAKLIAGAGCELLYLPPYSPDFNPIELAWAWIKRHVRRLAPRDKASRIEAINTVIRNLPEKFCSPWYKQSGVQMIYD